MIANEMEVLACAKFPKNLLGRHLYNSHFISEETEEKLNNLPKPHSQPVCLTQSIKMSESQRLFITEK